MFILKSSETPIRPVSDEWLSELTESVKTNVRSYTFPSDRNGTASLFNVNRIFIHADHNSRSSQRSNDWEKIGGHSKNEIRRLTIKFKSAKIVGQFSPRYISP